MNTGSLKKIDSVLNILSNINGGSHNQYTIAKKIEVDGDQKKFIEMVTILDKLCNDGYAKKYLVEGVVGAPLSVEEFSITFDGLVFIDEGGYEGRAEKSESKYRKEQSDIEVNKTIQYVIAATGIISSIYYILEILTNANAKNSLIIGITAIAFFGVYTFARKYLSRIFQIILFIIFFVGLIYLIRTIIPKEGLHVQDRGGLRHPSFVPNKVPPVVP